VIGFCPLQSEIRRASQFRKAQALVVWHDTQEVHSRFCSDEHISWSWMVVVFHDRSVSAVVTCPQEAVIRICALQRAVVHESIENSLADVL
jgi:hypothetical protein